MECVFKETDPWRLREAVERCFLLRRAELKEKTTITKKPKKQKSKKTTKKKTPKPKPPQHNWWGNLQCCHMIVQNHLSQNSFLFFPSGSSFYSSLVEDLAKEEETE